MKQTILVFFIISFGIFLRAYNWQDFPFGFDQIQILQNSDAILNGKLTLIGPRTGPAPLFTGPLIYYWTAIFSVIIPTPYSLIISTLVLNTVTGIAFYWLLKRYTNPQTAILGLILWSVSTYLIQLDRIPWNPNLSFIAASLVFVPLAAIIRGDKIGQKEKLLVSMGIFLGFQAHFSGLFLLPLALTGLILAKRLSANLFIFFLTAFILSLAPNVIFDIRHNWLNLHGIISIIQTAGDSSNPLIERIFHDILVAFENGGKFFSYTLEFLYKVIFGITVGILYLTSKRPRSEKLWTLIWIIGLPILYGFYSGSKPEYYYLIQFPVWVIVIASVLRLINRKILYITAIIFIGINIYSDWKIISLDNPLGLDNQLIIAKQINTLNPAEVIYNMPHATTYGLEYLTRLNPNSSKLITVEFPKNQTSSYKFENNHFGIVW